MSIQCTAQHCCIATSKTHTISSTFLGNLQVTPRGVTWRLPSVTWLTVYSVCLLFIPLPNSKSLPHWGHGTFSWILFMWSFKLWRLLNISLHSGHSSFLQQSIKILWREESDMHKKHTSICILQPLHSHSQSDFRFTSLRLDSVQTHYLKGKDYAFAIC